MLKFKLKSLEGLDENVAALYTKHEDGNFYLEVEGAVAKSKVDEFRDNNVELLRQLDEVKAKYGDIDLEQYQQLLKSQKDADDKEMVPRSELDSLVQAQVKTMRQEYDTKIEELTGTNGTLNRQLEGLVIDSAVRAASSTAKVRAEAVDDVLLRAKSTYRMDNGVAVPYEGNKVVYGKDGENPMPISEWVNGLSKTAPHLFEGSQGGGAGGGAGGGNIDTSKMSPTEKIKMGMEQQA